MEQRGGGGLRTTLIWFFMNPADVGGYKAERN